jgi:hypothetical protein
MKNAAARIAVVRVSAFAAPRAVMKPDPPPMPRPPPSDRCKQHHANKRKHNHEVNDDDNGFHGRTWLDWAGLVSPPTEGRGSIHAFVRNSNPACLQYGV